MTVKELIEKLREMPLDLPVCVAEDEWEIRMAEVDTITLYVYKCECTHLETEHLKNNPETGAPSPQGRCTKCECERLRTVVELPQIPAVVLS